MSSSNVKRVIDAEIWKLHGEWSINACIVFGDTVVACPFGEIGILRRSDGKSIKRLLDVHRYEYRRIQPFTLAWQPDRALGRQPTRQLFETVDASPLVDGLPKKLHSILGCEALVKLDPATGSERSGSRSSIE